jgi:hypothetical protein
LGSVAAQDAAKHERRDRTTREDDLLRVGNVSASVNAEIVLSAATLPVRQGLSLTPGWTIQGDLGNERFGHSVATAGDVNGDGYGDVIVGGQGYQTTGNDDGAGRARVFLGSAAGLFTSAAWEVVGEQLVEKFGWSVASAGDVNGDGYGDVIVGANRFNADTSTPCGGNSQPICDGRALLYLGSPNGLSILPAWTATGIGEFGYSVATAGDVNNDGYSDVIVGAPFVDIDGDNREDEGRTYLFLGSAGGLPGGLGATLGDADRVLQIAGRTLGLSVATAGDVNGDGFSDVVLGDTPFFGGGGALLYLGCDEAQVTCDGGLKPAPSWNPQSSQSFFGISIATAGDVNGDGFSDVIVGAGRFAETGQASIYLGCDDAQAACPGGLSTSPDWTAEGTGAFGISVATAGDVDGDGLGDVIVGARLFEIPDVGREAGQATCSSARTWISPSGPDPPPLLTMRIGPAVVRQTIVSENRSRRPAT